MKNFTKIFVCLGFLTIIFGGIATVSAAQDNKFEAKNPEKCIKENAGKKYINPADMEPCLNPAVAGELDSFRWIFTTWEFSRGIINLFAVIVLIVMSFANILYPWQALEPYRIRQLLPALIGGVIFANLSLFIVRAVVAFADVLMSAGGIQITVSDLFNNWGIDATKLSGTGGLIYAKFGDHLAGDIAGQIYQLIIAGIFVYLPIIMMLILSFIFYIRFAVIFFCAAISPLAFGSIMFPGTKKYLNQWWETFSKWAFGGVAAYFLLYLASTVGTLNNTTSAVNNNSTYTIDIFPYLISLALVAAAIKAPFALGGKIASSWGNVGKFLKNRAVAGTKFTGGTVLGLRKGGWGRNEIQKTKLFKGAMASPLGQAFMKYGRHGNTMGLKVDEEQWKELDQSYALTEFRTLDKKRVDHKEEMKQKLKNEHPDDWTDDVVESTANMRLVSEYDKDISGLLRKKYMSMMLEPIKANAEPLKDTTEAEMRPRLLAQAQALGISRITPDEDEQLALLYDVNKKLTKIKIDDVTGKAVKDSNGDYVRENMNWKELQPVLTLFQGLNLGAATGKDAENRKHLTALLMEMSGSALKAPATNILALPERVDLKQPAANGSPRIQGTSGPSPYSAPPQPPAAHASGGSWQDDAKGIFDHDKKIGVMALAMSKGMAGNMGSTNAQYLMKLKQLKRILKQALYETADKRTFGRNKAEDHDSFVESFNKFNRDENGAQLVPLQLPPQQQMSEILNTYQTRVDAPITNHMALTWNQHREQAQRAAGAVLEETALKGLGTSFKGNPGIDAKELFTRLDENERTLKTLTSQMANHSGSAEQKLEKAQTMLGERPEFKEIAQEKNLDQIESKVKQALEGYALVKYAAHEANHSYQEKKLAGGQPNMINELKTVLGDYGSAPESKLA